MQWDEILGRPNFIDLLIYCSSSSFSREELSLSLALFGQSSRQPGGLADSSRLLVLVGWNRERRPIARQWSHVIDYVVAGRVHQFVGWPASQPAGLLHWAHKRQARRPTVSPSAVF